MTLPATVEPLPGQFTFGKVVGRVIHLVADTAADTDDKPEAHGAIGKVTFTPQAVLTRAVGPDYPALVLQARETVALSSSGRLLDAEGREGIWLAVGTYKVSLVITGAPSPIPDFDIEVTAAHTAATPLDLAASAPFTTN